MTDDEDEQARADSTALLLRSLTLTAFELVQVEMERDRAIALLRAFIDDDPCQLDHHGYCQTHDVSPGPCRVAETIAFLEKYDRERTGEDRE